MEKSKVDENFDEDVKEFEDQPLHVIHKKKNVWITKTIAEDGPRDIFLHASLTETLELILILLIITTIVVGSVSPSMYYLTHIMKKEFIDGEFETVTEEPISFEEIKSGADFWAYLEHVFTYSFYWDYWYDHKKPVTETNDDYVAYENKLLGVARLRQVKVRNDTCTVFDSFRKQITECYGDYTSSNEDKEPFGPMTGTAWEYSKSKDNTLPYTFNSIYFTGGYYQDFQKTREESLKILEDLKTNLWITRGTRAVFLDFTVYNANMNFFCVVQYYGMQFIVFEYPSTGGVLPSSEILTLKFLRYTNNWEYFLLGLEIIFVVYTIYVLMEEIREIIYFKGSYFKKFWNYIDLTIVFMTFYCFIIGIYRYILVRKATDSYETNQDTYVDFYRVAVVQNSFNNFIAVILFFNYIKIFKYITFNKMMAQLNNTIKNCAADVAGFSIMFFIIFIAFAELGYLLFGTQVSSFSTFGTSMFTLLRTILGDFDYGEIEAVDYVLAPLYFLSFIILVFFVLLNMFLAIINDTYGDVKTELTVALDEMQMQQYLKRGYYNILRCCKCKITKIPEKIIINEFNVTIEEIRGALKKCGFSDLEIEMFFAKYNIDENATLGNYDINDLLKELEGKPKEIDRITPVSANVPVNRQTAPDGMPLVKVNDFLAQQEKLDAIDNKIEMLVEQVRELLKRLDTLDFVQKKI